MPAGRNIARLPNGIKPAPNDQLFLLYGDYSRLNPLRAVQYVPASAPVPGDLTGDGQVTLADLRVMLQMLLGQVPVDLTKADLTGDGQLSLADVLALMRML